MKKTLALVLGLMMLFAFTVFAGPGDDRFMGQIDKRFGETERAVADQGAVINQQAEKITALQAEINDLKTKLAKANDKFEALADRLDEMEDRGARWRDRKPEPTPVPTATFTPVPVKKARFKIEVIDVKTTETGVTPDKKELKYAYEIKMINKESKTVKNFKVLLLFKDKDGYTVSNFTTPVQELLRWEEKVLKGELTIKRNKADLVDKIVSEILWE